MIATVVFLNILPCVSLAFLNKGTFHLNDQSTFFLEIGEDESIKASLLILKNVS